MKPAHPISSACRRFIAISASALICAQALAQIPTPLQPQAAPSGVCAGLQAADLMQLTLPMALDHALCVNPSMRQAMAAIAERQAGVDLARSDYRPRVNAGAAINANRSTGNGDSSSGQNISGSVGLSWVLFDFGLRDAALAQSRAQLSGAMAGLSNTQLNAVGETLRLYVDALSVWLRLDSLRQAELVAEQSLRAASAKYDVQVGSLAEKLQAQTALAQTTLERVRASGQWEAARAALAVHMGFSITQRMGMPSLVTAVPFIETATNIDDMLNHLRQNHPRLRALQADVEAQRLRGRAVSAEGRGSVSVSANAQLARSLNLGSGGLERSLNTGIVANIPLFNDQEQVAKLAQNNAQTENKISQVEVARRELETELMRNILTVQTEIETRLAARALLMSAEQNHQVALGRYRGGIGTIVDLLNAQAAMSAARLALDQSYLLQAGALMRLASVVGSLPNTSNYK